MSRALITGVAGQDGSYLAELLLSRGYDVHGVVRPGRAPSVVDSRVTLHEADLASASSGIGELVGRVQPDELYNLAALSSVFQSWQQPRETAQVNGLAVAELLAAVRDLQQATGRQVRFVQASSAEIFGAADESPQTEDTRLKPVSPYGAAKAYAHHLAGVYRAAGLFAATCILYNHESPRRPEAFVTRKITAAVARISLGMQERVQLGNLEARRDWGWAPDYADALHRVATADAPGDFVIATGESHSVGDFARLAFARVGISDWRARVELSSALQRPAEPSTQLGDASKARRELGWRPSRGFNEIVAEMVGEDLRLLTPKV